MGRTGARLQLLGRAWITAVLLVGCSEPVRRSDGSVVDLAVPDLPHYPLDQTVARDRVFTDAEADAIRPDTFRPPDIGPLGVWTAPFFLDFEDDDGQLAGTRDWEWGQLSFLGETNCDVTNFSAPSSGHSGTGVWGTVLNDCYQPLDNAKEACANEDFQDDSILNLKASIPANFIEARLTYWEWADFFLPYDWSEIRINGQVIHQTCSGTLVSPPQWTKQEIDLSDQIGETITIGFHFMASGVVNYAGWYLDDLAITEF